MRITDNMVLAVTLAGQARSVRRLADAARVASSGERVVSPSQDPVAYAGRVGLEGRMSVLEGRARSATRLSGDLDLAESSLAQVGDLLVRAREIALRGANGSVDPRTRRDLSREVAELRGAVVGLGNTRGAGGYLFAGTRADGPPFDAAGTFSGNDGALAIEIADGVTTRANASGARAFTAAGGRDVLRDLQGLADALQRDDVVAIRASIDALDAGHGQVLSARVDAGLAGERLRSSADVISGALVSLRASRASLVEADLPSALTELSSARQAYERGVAVSRELLSTSAAARR